MQWPSIAFRFILVSILILGGQTAVEAQNAAPLAKAKKYHQILTRRPSAGYLFDRFYDAWLDQDTVEGLQAFLQHQVESGSGSKSAHRLLLAFFLAKQGNDPLALQQFRIALKDDPGNAALWYEKAVVEARTLDYDTALADLDKAEKQKADNKLTTKIAKLKGKLLVRNQQIEAAIAAWQQLLDKNPRDEDLYEDIIELQLNEGLYEQAAKLSESFVERTRDPYKKVIRGVRTGDIYQRGGKSEKALDVYVNNLQKLGADSWIEKEVLSQIEQIYRREDDLVGLKSQYTKMMEKYPKRISIKKRFASLLVDMGESELAIEQFKQVLELTPGDRANREEFIGMLGRLDKIPEATKQTQALIKQHADDPELRIQLANLLHQQEKKQAAAEAVNQFLAVSEKSEYAFLRASRLLTRFELLEEANEVYQSLTKAFPESVAAQEAFAAFLYDHKKKKAAALEIWKGIVKGKDRSQLVRVARILSGRKEHQAAFDLLQRRESDFAGDPIFLGQLVTSAVELKKFEQAIPWAARRVQVAKTVADLEGAIMQAADVISKADKGPEIIERMSSYEKPTVQQACLLAELHEREGVSSQADDVLAKAEGSQTPAGKLFVASQQVRLLSQRREWSDAAEALKKLIGLPGGRKSIHVRRLVELYQRDMKLDEALTWAQQWKKLSPGSTLPWLTESRLLSLQGKAKESLQVLRAAAQQFDDDMDLKARLAQAYANSSKPADARRIYWRLYEDSKDVSSKLRWAQELGRIAQSMGKVDRVIEQFEQRRENNRQSIVPLLALAEIHREAGDYEKRRNALLEATRVKPDDLDLLFHIARIEESEQDWERALKTLQRAAKVDKSNRSKEKMARLYLNYGDPDKGYAILYEVAGSSKSDWQDIESIADAMVGQQDWERVVTFLQPQLDRFPKNYRLAYMHACALEESGMVGTAAKQFVKLLDTKDEIPNLKTAMGNPMIPAGYLQQMQGAVPPATLELMSMMYMTRSVYTHRQPRRRGYMQMNLQLPPNVESVRPYVLTHLVELGRMGLDDEQIESVDKAASSKGVPSLELLRRMFPSMQRGFQVDASLVEEFPDNKALLGIWAIAGMNRQSLADEALVLKVFDTFKDSYPQLAAMAGLKASQQNPEMLKPTVDLFAKLNQPNDMLISQFSSILNQPQGLLIAGERDTEMENKLTQLLMRWYPQVQSRGGYQVNVLFSVILKRLRSNEDPTDYLKFLDDEVIRFRSSGKTNNQTAQQAIYTRSYSRNSNSLVPLSFPPLQLNDFPPHVLPETLSLDATTSMSPQAQMQMRMLMGRTGLQADTELKITPKSLEAVKDPILRLLLLNRIEQEELVQKGLKEMLDAEQPTIQGYLLAAGHAQSKSKPGEALKILERGRHLPMDRATRKQVDSAMVAGALEIDKLDEAQSKIAKDAALRLKAAKLSPAERQSLIPALATLGLEEEADKLQEQQAKLAATGRGGSRVFGGGYGGYASPPFQQGMQFSRRGSSNSIAKLIADGKKQQAIRALTSQLVMAGANVLSNPGGRARQYLDSQTRGLISRYKLKEDILKSVDPGNGESLAKLNRFASVCLVLGEQDKAKQAFESILKKRPRDMQARTQLMVMCDDPNEVVKYFEGIDARSLPMLGNVIQRFVGSYDLDVEKRLALLDGVRKYIEKIADFEKADLSWLSTTTLQIGQRLNTRGSSRYYSLYYQRRTTREGSFTDKRRKVHDDLCQLLIKHPRTSEIGFALLLAADAAYPIAKHDFLALAKKALSVCKAGNSNRFSFPRMSYNGRQVAFRTPSDYLAFNAAQSNNLDYIRDELLPQLKKSGLRTEVLAVESYLELFTVGADEFVNTARTYVKNFGRGNPYSDEGAGRVLEVWKTRKLNVDIGSVMVENAQQLVNNNYSNGPAVVTDYAMALVDKEMDPTDFLASITQVYLGPKAQQADFVKKHYNRNQVSSGTPNSRIHAYRNLIQQMAQKDQLLMPVMKSTGNLELLGDIGLTSQLGRALFQSKDTELARKLLESTVFVKDVDEFRAYASSNGRTTVWGETLNFIPRNSQKHQQLVEGAPTTFGWDLIRACGSADFQKDIFALFKKHRQQIDALPDDRKREIGMMAKNLLRRISRNSQQEQNEIVTWIQSLEARPKKDTGFADKVVKARSLSQISKDLSDHQKFQKEMTDLIRLDSAKAKEVFNKVVNLAKRAGVGTGVSGYSGGMPNLFAFFDHDTPVSTNLLQTILGEHTGGEVDAKTVAFALDLLAKADPEMPIDSGFAHPMSTFFRKNRGKNSKERVQALYKEFGNEIGETPVAILAQPLNEFLQGFSTKDLESVVEWATSEAKSGAHPKLAAELMAAAKFRLASNRPRKPNEERKFLPKDYAHYMSVLDDNELPITWRQYVASWLFQGVPNDDVMLGAVNLLTQEKKGLIHSRSLLQNVLRKLPLVESSDIRKEAGTRLTTYWNKALLRPTGQLAVMQRQGSFPFASESIALPLMSINIELGQPSEFMKLYRKYGQNFSHSNELLAVLIQYDKLDEAKRLFDYRLQNGSYANAYSSGSFHYNEVLEKKIPGFLEKLAHQDERYVAEIHLAAINDAQRSRSANTKKDAWPRTKRLQQVASKFGEIEFGSEEMKEATVSLLLSVHPDCVLGENSPIRDSLVKLVESYDIEDSMDYQSGVRNRYNLYRGYVRSALGKGNLDSTAKMIDQVAASKLEDRDHGKRQLLRALLDPLEQSMREGSLISRDKKDLVKLAAAMRKLSDPKREDLNRYVHNLMVTSVAIQVLAGQHEEFEKQLAPRKQSASNQPPSYRFYSHNLFAAFGRSSRNKGTELSKERKIEILGSLMRCLDALDQIEVSSRGGRGYVSLRYQGAFEHALNRMSLLKMDDLVENAEELAKTDGGYSWAVVAMHLDQSHGHSRPSGTKTDDSTEKVVDAWKNAIAAARNKTSEARFRMALANVFKRLNRTEDAKKVMSEQKELPAKVKREFERLLKSLSFNRLSEPKTRFASKTLLAFCNSPSHDLTQRHRVQTPDLRLGV